MFWSKVLVVVAVVLLRLGLGNLSTSLFCDDDGDRKWIFLQVVVLELSVKSSSFCANVKAFILALPPERKYISLASFAQNCFLILICSCYLLKVFSFILSNLYTQTYIKHRYFYFLQLWAKDVGAGLWWKAKVSLTIESFEDIQTEKFLCTSL